MDISADILPVIAQAADPTKGLQGHRPRRRRRIGHHRPRHRRRVHLRQGHRVGDPPARDARRDHLDPVAGLRADRGDRVLRVHLRPDRVLPPRWTGALIDRSPPDSSGNFLVIPERGADDLDADRVLRHSSCCASSPSRASRRRSQRRQKAIDESIDAAERTRRGRRAAGGVPRAPEGGARAGRGDRGPRAQGGRGPRARDRGGRPAARARSCWRPRAGTSRRRPSARSRSCARRSPT